MLSLQQLSYRPRDVGPLSLTLSSGQMVWIAGASGSGKSTLCALLTGDLEPSDGQLEGSLGRVATISSEVESHLLGATVRQELDWVPRVSSPLRSPGLEALEARWLGREEEDPHTLSRGEQQLLLLCAYARGDFQTLILDESLSCLDHQAFVLVMECLRLLTEGGRLVLVVSHEARVLPWVDRCLGLGEGRLRLDKPAAELTTEDLETVRLWPGTLGAPWGAVCSGRPATAAPRAELASFPGTPLALGSGELLALAGPTGSGKSQLLRALMGWPAPPGWWIAQRGYRVLLPQEPGCLFWRRTVRAEVQASLREGSRRRGAPSLEQALSEFPESWWDRSPRSLSAGQTRFLAALCLLWQTPDTLLLDEPFRGLDAVLRQRLERHLWAYLEGGGQALMTAHRADELVLYPHTLLVLEALCPVYSGEPWAYFEAWPDGVLGCPSSAPPG